MVHEISLESGAGRVVALDLGSRRIGVAMSDPTRLIAQAWGKFELRSSKDLRWIDELEKLVSEEGVSEILIGLPLHMNGDEGTQALKARETGAMLEQKLKLPVNYIDERQTTQAAEQTLITAGLSRKKRKGVIDSLSAQVFLQEYLDH